MSDDRVLTIERYLDAAPEDVFDAWTDPDILKKWWGPDGVTIPHHALQVSEGGSWTTTMHSEEMGSNTVSGVYKTIDRPSRLVFTWAWSQEDGSRGHETEVEVRFEKASNGTKMTFNQKTFADAGQRDNHKMGWTSSFDCLARSLG